MRDGEDSVMTEPRIRRRKKSQASEHVSSSMGLCDLCTGRKTFKDVSSL